MPGGSDAITLAAVAVAVAGVDQLAKAAVVAAIGPARPESRIAIGNGWIALEYAQNRGAAFGLFAELTPLLVIASIGIVVGFLVHYFRSTRTPPWSAVGIGMIAGGAAGNLVDRLRLGYVIDFVSVGPWPNFNVADSAITVGVLVLTWGWLRSDWGADKSSAG